MSRRKSKLNPTCPTHGHRLEGMQTRYGWRMKCPEAGCSVACWEGSTSTPADDATRQARIRAHALFDPLWQDDKGRFSSGKRPNRPGVRRDRAYRWLASEMGIEKNKCHIGFFTLAQCEQAIEILLAEGAEQVTA